VLEVLAELGSMVRPPDYPTAGIARSSNPQILRSSNPEIL
jgi:hypothetical protein